MERLLKWQDVLEFCKKLKTNRKRNENQVKLYLSSGFTLTWERHSCQLNMHSCRKNSFALCCALPPHLSGVGLIKLVSDSRVIPPRLLLLHFTIYQLRAVTTNDRCNVSYSMSKFICNLQLLGNTLPNLGVLMLLATNSGFVHRVDRERRVFVCESMCIDEEPRRRRQGYVRWIAVALQRNNAPPAEPVPCRDAHNSLLPRWQLCTPNSLLSQWQLCRPVIGCQILAVRSAGLLMFMQVHLWDICVHSARATIIVVEFKGYMRII